MGVPVIAVLGNHDLHDDEPERVRACLEKAGITVLEGEATVLDVRGTSLAIAGTIGFGHGFLGGSASEFGEPLMKAFVRRAKELAASLDGALRSADAARADVRVVLTHYAPVEDTLGDEPREIFPFLGSYLLGEVADEHLVDLYLHGHAHRGAEHGTTPGGVPVRNVAPPVIEAAYRVYELAPRPTAAADPAATGAATPSAAARDRRARAPGRRAPPAAGRRRRCAR